MYEAREIARNIKFVDKIEREIGRYQLYVLIQSNSKKKYSPKDILELPWDDKWLDKTEFKYNEEEEKEYNEKAQNIANMLNSGSINFESTNLMKSKSMETNITN